MKKIILSLFLFLTIFSISTKPSFADCKNRGLFGCDSNHGFACGDGKTCCYTSGECGQYPGAGVSNAGCTVVASNQTTCSGIQTVCSQVVPPAGNIKRWCCDNQTSCDAVKGIVQQQITNQMATSSTVSDPTCNSGSGIDTAIGCIPVNDTNAFMGWVLGWAVGVGGGIAFLLIVYASFMVMTSQGDPARLKAGQELLTSAISGLIMLIFSVFILKFIGIDILGLDKL